MTVKIERCTQINVPINLEGSIEKLLKVVPADHLVNLEKIVLVDWIHNKQKFGKERIEGVYHPKNDLGYAYIEIAVKTLERKIPNLVYSFSYFWCYEFAIVLYHEIGHHYAQSLHGIKKEEWESFAERYMKRKLRKAFPATAMIACVINMPYKIIKKMRKKKK